MDLRPFLTDPKLVDDGLSLIHQRLLCYQPFILADGIEVGEGQNLEENYRNCASAYDGNVYLAPHYLDRFPDATRKFAEDAQRFTFCNEKYRQCYETLADSIVNGVGGDISSFSFLEIGCNSGLNLFNLARRGARYCLGVDWTDYDSVFLWLNRALSTTVRFRKGKYDNLRHRLDLDIDEFDVVVNTIFMNHQSDPMHFLCYLADHARHALALWVLLDDSDDEKLAINYTYVSGVHDLASAARFPLVLHNGVSMSVSLFLHALRYLGFGDVQFIRQPTDPSRSPPSGLHLFSMVFARRTHPFKSAFWRDRETDRR